ncbi:MAG TPA: YicC family protein [Candidatus Faecousia gallistercoris]|nr:YicC family protein [Candidatus Faecousia gallistercoris]
MTGYGRAVKTLLGREFTVELRAVNNRYLDCTVKLPRSLTFAEEGVKQRVKAAVARGKVDVLISVGAAAGEPVQVSLNRPVLEGYLQAMNAMVQEYGVHNDISAAALARLPEVFLVEKPKEDEDELLSALLQVVDEALAAFNAMRAAEGAAMEADLQSRGQTILNLVAQVEAGSPQTVADYRARLEAKMQEVLERTAIDESRILQEAAMFADKVAVDEETVRLRSHLSQMQAMLSGGGAIGRKLDFLLQEMNREANTIGSKCTDLALARVVVEIKAELEKIREQAQNIE